MTSVLASRQKWGNDLVASEYITNRSVTIVGPYTGSYGSGSVNLTFRLADNDKRVVMTFPGISLASITPGTVDFAIGTVPADFRPSVNLYFTSQGCFNSLLQFQCIQIGSNGAITIGLPPASADGPVVPFAGVTAVNFINPCMLSWDAN